MAQGEQSVYVPSGKFAGATIPAGIIGGIIAGMVLGWFYQLSVDWIPLIYFNVIGTMAFGFVLGLAMGKIFQVAHCRNLSVATLITVLVALVAVGSTFFFAYYRAFSSVIEKEGSGITFAVVWREFPITKYIEKRVENGWTIGKSKSGLPLTGVFVYLIWLIEAGIVTALAASGARDAAGEPYCETCERWSEAEVVGNKLQVPAEAIEKAKVAADAEAWIALPTGGGPDHLLEFKIEGCKGCHRMAFLTVTRKWVEVNSKGEKETKTEALAERMTLSGQQRDALKTAFPAPAQPAEPPAAPPSA